MEKMLQIESLLTNVKYVQITISNYKEYSCGCIDSGVTITELGCIEDAYDREVDFCVDSDFKIADFFSKNGKDGVIDFLNQMDIATITNVDTIGEYGIGIDCDSERYCNLGECNDCQTIKFFKPSPEFDDMLLSHGVATGFESIPTVSKAESNIETIIEHPEYEICFSHHTQTLGVCGIYAKGENVIVSNVDLYSEVNSKGRRKFYVELCESDIVTSMHDYKLGKEKHNEHIVKNVKIEGLWLKKNSNSAYLNMLKRIKVKLEDLYGYEIPISIV